MITFGCTVPGGSFMPEGVNGVPQSPEKQLIDNCRSALDAGYDFTECGGSMLMSLDEDQIRTLIRADAVDPLGLLAVNSLFPAAFRLSQAEAPVETYVDYAVCLFDRMAALGARYAVLGSGAARTLSAASEAERARAMSTLTAFIERIGREADVRGITVVIEPLRRRETDVFHTVPETGDFVRRLNAPGVGLLCDAFHMAEEGSDPACIVPYMDLIRHCHIAEAPNRTPPGSPDSGDLEYNRLFARNLLCAGYAGGVSVECGYRDFREDIRVALAHLKTLFA